MRQVKIHRGRDGSGPTGTAVVVCKTLKDASDAVRRFDGYEWRGRVLVVRIDTAKSNSRGNDSTNEEPPLPCAAPLQQRRLFPVRAEVTQLAKRPAYRYRPPPTSPEGQESMAALLRDGKEFTGFHDDPAKRHFAAHRVLRKTWKDVAVPVDLQPPESEEQMTAHLLWMRA